MAEWKAALVAAFSIVACCAPARGADISLTAIDGGFGIEGTLLGYDGAFFRLETEYGEISVDAGRVECAGEACPDPETFVPQIIFSGERAAGLDLLAPLIETFAARRGYRLERRVEGRQTSFLLGEGQDGPEIATFVFRAGTSAEGFADLVADEADLALSTREVTAGEADLARQAGRGDLRAPGRSRILGLDGLVPIVSVANPVRSISFDDLRAVLSGELTDWSDLSAELSGPIALHLPEPAGGATQGILQRISGAPDARPTPSATFHPDDAGLAAQVAAEPGALGIAPYSRMGNAQPVALAGPCGTVSLADEMSLRTEDYPLTAPIFLYRPARRLPEIAQAFLDYAISPAAQPVIDRAGYVDQFPRAIPISDQGDRFANAILRSEAGITLGELRRMAAALDGKARLSISFRFEGGSSVLDAQSRSNVALLAGALGRGVFDDRSLLFAGFSDGQGPRSDNRRLAAERAETVRDAVMAAIRGRESDRVSLQTAAFGEAMPMACDETAWGRQVNRRVEVWLD